MKIQILKPYLATAIATPSLAPLLRYVMTRNPNSLHNSNRHHQGRVFIDIYLIWRHKVDEEENFFAITTTSKPEQETRILEELMMIFRHPIKIEFQEVDPFYGPLKPKLMQLLGNSCFHYIT
ncbi:unnamed protein product [Lactuca virosa]|uniref:Uncharacterized protein n=1 Tax=Lactuca virosa TaxID=75947 RepID=A0AAU9MFR0_9ASTR|nr:unnamed protein product [Lactuca virosa]